MTLIQLEYFRPMLSAKLPSDKKNVPTQEQVIQDLSRLDWSEGFLASPKLDGIRAVKTPTGLVSRTLTPIPNRWIQECLSSSIYDYFDGELIKGGVEEKINFNDTQSAVMSHMGSPEFTYAIFDELSQPHLRFDIRSNYAKDRIQQLNPPGGAFKVEWVIQTFVRNIDELLRYEEEIVQEGYEGVIIRDPRNQYKNNRSTFREQGMIKLKRFQDAEATIIGFEELYRNTNKATISAIGYTKRSSANAGQIPAGTLGLLKVRGLNGRFVGVEFEVGSGFDDSTRDLIWGNQEQYLGRIIKYKFQDAGAKNKPRAPIFLGFRSSEDL